MSTRKELEVIESMDESDFIENCIKKNKPALIKNMEFDVDKWTPEFFDSLIGDLPVQVYDALFDLQEISTLSSYIDEHFDQDKKNIASGNSKFRENVPYIRWYSKLKDVEYAWSDEAFSRLSNYWEKPSFLPDRNLIIPDTSGERKANPVKDYFPYRGLLVAAKSARTRLHRDPFCTDAVVSQFYGKKEIALYSPDRSSELLNVEANSTSFGGFVDVRGSDLNKLSHEPDYHGYIQPGEIVYIPHGWLHDVIVTEDSISVTWNFIHSMGALEYIDYLMDGPEGDAEFEVLKYFYSLSGNTFKSASEILKKYNKVFSDIEESLCG